MKRIIVYAVLVLAGAGIVFWLSGSKETTTLDVEETDFAVAETDRIDKLVLKDRSGNKATLTKDENGTWWINDEHIANESRLETLMQTLRRVEVKSPVPTTQRENVIKNMAASSRYIEIYKDGTLTKAYYIGGKTPDQKGTYMIIDGAENPYITHIPGFFGYLSIRYFAEAHEWKTPRIFPFQPNKIQTVDISYRDNPDASIRIEALDEGYNLYTGAGNEKVQAEIDMRNLRRVLTSISKFQYEGIVTYKSKEEVARIHSQKPIKTIKVTAVNGESVTLPIHPKPADIRTKTFPDEDGVNTEKDFDGDKRLGFINNERNQLVLLQEMTLKPILRDPSYFIKDGIVSKN